MTKIASIGRGFRIRYGFNYIPWILRNLKQTRFLKNKFTYLRVNSTCERSVVSRGFKLKILRAQESVHRLNEITFSFNSFGAWKNALNTVAKYRTRPRTGPHTVLNNSCKMKSYFSFYIFNSFTINLMIRLYYFTLSLECVSSRTGTSHLCLILSVCFNCDWVFQSAVICVWPFAGLRHEFFYPVNKILDFKFYQRGNASKLIDFKEDFDLISWFQKVWLKNSLEIFFFSFTFNACEYTAVHSCGQGPFSPFHISLYIHVYCR